MDLEQAEGYSEGRRDSASLNKAFRQFSPNPAVAVVFVVALIFYLQKKRSNKLKRQLPGPSGLPFLGSILALWRNPLGKMREYAAVYGPIYKMKLGSTTVVMVNSIEVLREAFLTKGLVFNNRPKMFSKLLGLDNKGIVLLQQGEFHDEQRKLFSKVVRSINPEVFDMNVQTHMKTLKQTLKDSKELPINMCLLLSNINFATVGHFIFGVNTDVEHIRHLVEGNLSNNPIIVLSAKVMPKSIKRRLSKWVDMSTNFQKSIRRILELVRKQQHDIGNNVGFTDLIGGFLQIYNESLSQKIFPYVDETNSTSNEQLAAILMDCYQAGVEATSGQLKWVFLYLARNPRIQIKIQEEIDRVIGQEVIPSVKHKRQCNYIQATMNEVLRIRPAASLGAPHSNSTYATLGSYDIEPDTLILTNIWAIHMDPRYWDHPEKFNPQRFLNSKGNLRCRESFQPFSVGNRRCPGEHIAKNLIFLLITNILQDFNITIAEEPSHGLGQQGINFAPYDYTIIATPREKNGAKN